MIKLTIIIPIYNRAKTIKKTLDSIVNQLDENTELMLINDGSTDELESIITEYINNYDGRISYYSKQNEGVAATRNFGIQHAKGSYIMFVDSDDYIDGTLIEKIQTYLNQNIDIIKFKVKCVDENENVLYKIDGPTFSMLDGKEAFNTLVFEDNLIDSPCVYALKKNLFIDNNLYFREGTYHEDLGLIPLILLISKSVVSIDFYGYFYVQTKNSITRNNDYSRNIKRFEDTLLHYDNMLQFTNKLNLDKKTNENVKIYYTNSILLKLKLINKKDRSKYIKEIRKRKMLKNIKIRNLKQLIKKIVLYLNINWYLSMVNN